MDSNPVRYPDPAVQVLDPSFEQYRIRSAAVERLATGFRWAEGPVWFGDGRYLLWSDIPNNRIMKWDEETGVVGVFRKPSNYANGNTRDRQGRLVTCEHGSRRVTRTEYDGTITVLADRYDGKPLNSPNDVIVKSDDSVWFTDPEFGILGHYEGHKAEPELPTNVYRIDGKTGEITVVIADIPRPNGLCFSPDESRLYIVVSGTTPREIMVYDVARGKRPVNGRLFVNTGPGSPTASAAISTAISGAASVAAKGSTASSSSIRPARRSAASCCRSAARTCASAARNAIACSWPAASRCIPCMSTRRAQP